MMEAVFVFICLFVFASSVEYVQSDIKTWLEVSRSPLHFLRRHLRSSGYEAPSNKVSVIIKDF